MEHGEKIIFSSEEEARNSMYTGDRKRDLEVANALLSGNYDIGSKVEHEIEDSAQDQVSDEVVETSEVKQEDGVVEEPVIFNEELEIERRRAEMLEQQLKEENERYLSELRQREEELKKEKIAREELEKSLRKLDELQQSRPTNSNGEVSEAEEDEFASDYAKETRKMVNELKSAVGPDNPVIRELLEKVSKFEAEITVNKEREAKLKAEKQKKEAEEKLYDSINKFQMSVPELKTEDSIKVLDEEYKRFRKDIAYVSKASSILELENAIKDYMNNGKTKELAGQYGVKPVKDLDKYLEILELLDLKNGIQYDPVTGREIPVTDDHGVQVRYRSLEEAYKIKNYDKELDRMRKQSFKDVGKKLQQLSDAPVTLSNEKTQSVASDMTPEQEKEILNMDPKIWSRDPEKRKLVQMVYAKRGLEMPRYRGR